MNVKLLRTTSFVHACALVQIDENGKQHQAKLRVRFNAIPRGKWDELTQADADDDRLLFDVVVKGIEDTIEVDGEALSPDAALQAVREDLSLSGQVVDQFMEINFGAAAKNARRSRGR